MKKILEFFKKLFAKSKPSKVIEKPKEEITALNLYSVLCEVCESYKYLKETNGKNRSPVIDKMILNFGGKLGQPYCIYGIQQVLQDIKNIYYERSKKVIHFDLPVTGGSQKMWHHTKDKYKLKHPKPCSICIYQKIGTDLGHGAIVLSYEFEHSFNTFEFNTSSSSKVDRDGEGAYFKIRSVEGFSDMKILGYIDLELAMLDLTNI